MNGIFPRSLISLLVAGAIPVALMLAAAGWWALRAMDESKSDSTVRVAREVAAQIEVALDGAARELETLARDENLLSRTKDPEQRIAELRRIGEINPSFTEIALYDAKGYIIESTSSVSSTQEKTTWFETALCGNATISRPFVMPRGVDFSFAAYVPVNRPEMSDVAVIKATLPFASVHRLIRRVDLLPGEQLLALDPFGNVVSSSAEGDQFQPFDLKNRSNVWLPAGSYDAPDGARFRYVSALASPSGALSGEHLRLLWLTPEGYFTSAHWDVIRLILLVAVVAAIPLCLLGCVMARSLSQPLIRAAARVRGLSDGDFDTEISPQGPREMQDLARAFNSTVNKVRERTRELEEANQSLEQSGRMKDRFLSTMSHELRTPLNAIIGFSEALQTQVYGALSNSQHGSVQSIKDAGEQLLGLIDDILDAGKLTTGELELHLDQVRLKPVCDASLGKARGAAQDKSIKLTGAVDQSAVLFADRRRIEQILDNLLDNAIKFTPNGGLVHLEARRNPEAGEVVIRVIDSGIGIAKINLARLFHPFVQLDARIDREHGGSGLGLTIVRELAELQGGSISVESKPGFGSEFILRLPVAADAGASEPEREETEPSRPAPSKPRNASSEIVLIEDNELNIIPIRNLLQSMHHCVRVAHSGRDAINLARSYPPQLVVLDAQTVGADDAEILGELSLASGGTRIPSIAFTLPGDPRLLHPATPGGPDRYLAKPVQRERLEEAVRDLLSA